MFKCIVAGRPNVFLLAKGTFNYLLGIRKQDFQLIDHEDNRSIKITVTVLDGISKFLKPYLIFSFIWTLIGIWIQQRIAYDSSTVVFGKLQLLLREITSMTLIIKLGEYKTAITLFWGIICICIPFLYARKQHSDKIKRIFSDSLLYLSLIANVSLFGAMTANALDHRGREMKALQQHIEGIHQDIFKAVVVQVETIGMEEALENEQLEYAKELERTDSLTKDIVLAGLVPADLAAFKEKMISSNAAEIDFSAAVDLDHLKLPPPPTSGRDGFEPMDYQTLSNPQTRDNGPVSDGYLFDKYSWNLSEGRRIKIQVDGVIQKANLEVPPTQRGSKLKEIFELAFDHGFDVALDRLGDTMLATLNLSTEENKTFKELFSILLSEKSKHRCWRASKAVCPILKQVSKKVTRH